MTKNKILWWERSIGRLGDKNLNQIYLSRSGLDIYCPIYNLHQSEIGFWTKPWVNLWIVVGTGNLSMCWQLGWELEYRPHLSQLSANESVLPTPFFQCTIKFDQLFNEKSCLRSLKTTFYRNLKNAIYF